MNQPIIFLDWDGTIADSMELCFAEIKLALTRMGLPLRSDDRIAACNGPTQEESADILEIPASRKAEYLDQRRQAEFEVIPLTAKLYPHAEVTLDRLAKAAKLMVVTNGYQEYVRRSAAFTGVLKYFDRIEAAIPGRNKSETIAMLLKEYQPHSAVMAGDRLGDLESGRLNGLNTVAACYGYGSPEEWKNATLLANNLPELGTAVLQLLNSVDTVYH